MSTNFSRILTSYLIQSYLLKSQSIKLQPLMFSWEIYEFFEAAEAATRHVL